MYSYTLENIKRDVNQDGLYNLFRQTVLDKFSLKLVDYVRETETGRLDLISDRLYGTDIYVEELMLINNIINSWNIKSGDYIFYVPNPETYRLLEKDDEDTDIVAKPINKNTRKDPNRVEGVIPTIKPLDFEQIIIDKKNKKIKLNTKLI